MSKNALDKLDRSTTHRRRLPSQARAKNTIDVLLEATTQILESEGEDSLTTNKVASISGFSIGTIYQYFPGKEALIQAIGWRLQNQVLGQMERHFNGLKLQIDIDKRNPYALVEEAIGLVLESMTLGGSNKSLLRLLWTLEPEGQTTIAAKRMAEILSSLFEQAQHPQIKTPTMTELYVVTRAVLGVVRYASLDESPLLGSNSLKQALARMTFGLLQHKIN